MNGYKILIHHPCPQCGGQVTLEDTDRIFQCPYCRVRLVVRSHPQGIYVLPAGASYQRRSLIHIPYWRFRGLVFALDASDVTYRVLESSALAVEASGIPISLGLRPQTIGAAFYGPQLPGRFLRPSIALADFLKSLGSGLRGRLKTPSSRIAYQAFIGESVSLVYAPFFEQDGLRHDAITGRILGPMPEEVLSGSPEPNPDHRLTFLPTLCPRCGGDMDGERDALVLRCRTCLEFWETNGSGFHRLDVGFVPASGGESFWIPFWVLDVAGKAFSLETYGDFAALACLPKKVPAKEASRPFRFWVPAFKVAPQFFVRLGRVATIGQLWDLADDPPPFEALHPVTLPSVEAFQACPILLGASTPAKDRLFAKIRGARLAFRGKKLAYLPLRRLSSEWVLEPFSVALPRNALRWGRTL